MVITLDLFRCDWLIGHDVIFPPSKHASSLPHFPTLRDANKFRDSSCGVQFFSSISAPPSYQILTIFGFVEELMVNDDPEYQVEFCPALPMPSFVFTIAFL